MTYLRTSAARSVALDIARRAQSAISAQQDQLMWEAALLLYPYQHEDHAIRARVRTLIDLAASESAAIELVPGGCAFSEGVTWSMGDCGSLDIPWACITVQSEDCPDYTANGDTPGLAMVAACMLAHGSHPYSLDEEAGDD